MKRAIKMGHLTIGPDHPPIIVAEVSANHNQSLSRAMQIVEAAKAAGAHAIKLQTYTPDTMTLDVHQKEFVIEQGLWKGRALYELYEEAQTPWEWHVPIFQYCKQLGLLAFSSPFDETAIDFLESLHVPCYKIASLEIIDLPLIRKAASTKKPLILSLGGATIQEIEEAINAARSAGGEDMILLKCTTAYPASLKDANLITLTDMQKRFDTLVGVSDHTLDLAVPLVGISYGACMIEKHFTLSRDDGGPDSAFSLEPLEMKELVNQSLVAWQSLGHIQYGPVASEKLMLKLRRSLYFVSDLNVGETIKPEHIRAIRPGQGISPKEKDNVIGRKVTCNVKRGDPVLWENIL